MTDSGNDLTILTRCYDMTEAHIVRGFLESNDIPCFIIDEHHNMIAWHLSFALGGARIMVHQEDLQKAMDFLGQMPSSPKKEETFFKKPYLPNLFMAIVGLIYMVPIRWPSKNASSEKDIE